MPAVTDADRLTSSPAGVIASSHPSCTEQISVHSLITNRPIKYPIFDANGLLLLAEGSVITTKFKELLRARDITQVRMHDDDVRAATLTEHSDSDKIPEVRFDPELTAKLDRIIESGNLFVANTGDALVEQMNRIGCRGYNRKERERVIGSHRKASAALDGCLQDALRGNPVDGKQLLNTTGQYLTATMSDADCVLSVVLEVGDDTRLSNHCLRMSVLAMAIGIEMGLDEQNTRTLGLCGLLHDWGMVKVPQAIRDAKRILSEGDFVAIKRHPIHTLELLEKVKDLPPIVPLVTYQVHERPDGNGYPRGRRMRETHLFARILGVADAYLALTSPRPYRGALMPYAAMECLITQASQRCFDPGVVKALLQIMSLFPIGSYVVLSNGTVARVLRRSGSEYGKPIVQIVAGPDGTKVPESDETATYDLSTSSDLHVVQALPTPGEHQLALSPELVTIKREPV
ncbi:MAG: HD domain-containing protein [Planctomycetaceae bacterium]|nr:HD domain-containing protein [Planctomycetales bacterium]MCB9938284.1 HD domain-containing protein [Planctomycetaceae bacterium]